MYRVIACGVNQGPSAKPLQFAEKDAADFAAFFRGALGPPVSDEQVVLLQGSAASARSIELAIIGAGLLSDATTYLVFYFSGHGGRDGVLTSTGILPYESIIQALRLASIPFTTVILDVCFAASYLGFLKEARVGGLGMPPDLQLQWLHALASATPGTRLIFSTGADRTSGESTQLANGVFTNAFLTALKRCRGDLVLGEGVSWVSDQRAFAAARHLLVTRTAGKQVPVERGLTGDFPLALSQAEEPVGTAHFLRTSIEAGSLTVRFQIEERKHVETRVRWKLLNAFGEEIASSADALHPTEEAEAYGGRIECPHARVRSDDASRLHRMTYGEAPLEWVLSIEDELGRVLDEKVVPARYRW